MQGFVYNERVEPTKKDVLARIKNFDEIYEVFGSDEAEVQAERCIQCGDPYCHNKCPLHNFIPQWLKSTAIKDLELAFKISNQSSPFPEIMGRICPHDRLCEGDCTLNDGHGAITIGSVETYISETAFEKGITPTYPQPSTGKKVAIVGSGPAGLSAATFLMRQGVSVTMYERSDRAGGLLTYGIPNFKLDKNVVARRIEWLLQAGMTLHLSQDIGKDITLSDLRGQFDAVILAVGATKSNQAGLVGEDHPDVFKAIDFLTEIQKANCGSACDALYRVKGKNVVVIGGGDTAMDCLRTSIREGASSVRCLYRRDKANMPGSRKEYKNAVEEGAEFSFLTAPKEIVITDGKVTGVKVVTMALGEPDAKGRQSVTEVAGSETMIPCDIVIMALGFSVSLPQSFLDAGVQTNNWGGVIINNNYQTSLEGVYAAGDCYRGADLVVTAAFDGRETAQAICQKLLAD